MKFLDVAKVTFKAGNGGSGIVAFHREKYVDKGGPSGGDGGSGGSIFVKGSHNLNTLYEINFKKHILAPNGANGEGKLKHGKNADDLFIDVPLGTILTKKDGTKIGEITKDQELLLVAKGGSGGRGNARFKSSINKVPHLSENGSLGEEIEVNLELKILADVSLVGFPSVGKSSLISVLTNAKPKIADYSFTTLIPNIGICKFNEKTFVIADVPGLIEGAAKGKGLGQQFLRHIERSKLILHILDASWNIELMLKNIEIIKKELSNFSKKLTDLKVVFVVNKIDAISDQNLEVLKNKFPKFIFISAIYKKNLSELKETIWDELEKIKKVYNFANKNEKTFHYYKFNPVKKDIEISISNGEYNLFGSLIEYWTKRIPMNTNQNIMRLRQKLVKNGIFKELEKKGWKEGDTINIFVNGEIYEFK